MRAAAERVRRAGAFPDPKLLVAIESLAVTLARDCTGVALTAYRGGTGTLVAVIEAQRAETEVRLSQVAAEAQRARAWAQLAYLIEESANEAR